MTETDIDAKIEQWWRDFRAWEDAQPECSEVEYMDLHERVNAYFAAQDGNRK